MRIRGFFLGGGGGGVLHSPYSPGRYGHGCSVNSKYKVWIIQNNNQKISPMAVSEASTSCCSQTCTSCREYNSPHLQLDQTAYSFVLAIGIEKDWSARDEVHKSQPNHKLHVYYLGLKMDEQSILPMKIWFTAILTRGSSGCAWFWWKVFESRLSN